MTEQNQGKADAIPAEVQRRIDAAEVEEAQFLEGVAAELRAMHLAQIRAQVQQIAWLRERTIVLNVAVRERDEELASLRAQLAAYQTSEQIDQVAKVQTGEPGEDHGHP